MSVHLYAYATSDADESDPDQLFDVTTDDVATVLREQFPDAEYEFVHEDESAWVFAVYDDGEHVASLYSEYVSQSRGRTLSPLASCPHAKWRNSSTLHRLACACSFDHAVTVTRHRDRVVAAASPRRR
ncbi:MAG: hypothetical protein HYZ38_28975 [Mycobacterium sp.]|nr:hypothetical protein [Mycobacterium sp.]